MYGLSTPSSSANYSCACASSTDGANGRNDSRNLILRFMTDCISGLRGSPRMLRGRAPRAELHPALEPADDLAVGQSARPHRRTVLVVVEGLVTNARAGRADARISLVGVTRPEQRSVLAVVRRPDSARCPSSWCQMNERDAQRAAGVSGRRLNPDPSNGPSRRMRPLATQLSATPPARQRCFEPVCAWTCRAQPQHDLLGDCLDRRREVHLALGDRRLGQRAAGRRTGGRTAARSSSGPGNS